MNLKNFIVRISFWVPFACQSNSLEEYNLKFKSTKKDQLDSFYARLESMWGPLWTPHLQRKQRARRVRCRASAESIFVWMTKLTLAQVFLGRKRIQIASIKTLLFESCFTWYLKIKMLNYFCFINVLWLGVMPL